MKTSSLNLRDRGANGAVRFTDILFIIVILVVLGYGFYFYLRSQRTKEIKDLDKRKNIVMSVPIPDHLFTLKNMELSGKTKRKYEEFVAEWQTITNYQFSEIESALVGAEQFADQMNFMKAKSVLDEAEEMLRVAEEQVQALDAELLGLLEIQTENTQIYDALMERYNVARKSVMNHSFDYGPAIETLEKNLQYLELNFTKYNELTTSGDYLEAHDLLKTIDSDMLTLEEILEKIPAMYTKIKDDYEESLEDIREGYEKMLEAHFNFGDFDITQELEEIQEKLNEAKSRIKNADLVEAKTQMDKADRNINTLYDYLEQEVQARDYITKNSLQLRRQIEDSMENSRYASIEVDRIAQSYVLHHNEVDQVGQLNEQIKREYQRFSDLMKEIDAHQLIYTQAESDMKKIKKRVDEIDDKQGKIVEQLSDMNLKEKETKQNLDVYELDLRNLKRKIEKHHLPGLNETYYNLFYQVTNEIEELAKQLNRVRIDLKEIEKLEDKLIEDLNQLDQLTEETVDNAMLTEYMIQHSNRFIYDYPEVDHAIKEAQYLFHKEFRYAESLAVIEKALHRVDSNAPTQVRRMYHEEKQTRIY